jgi:hypothetical protein
MVASPPVDESYTKQGISTELNCSRKVLFYPEVLKKRICQKGQKGNHHSQKKINTWQRIMRIQMNMTKELKLVVVDEGMWWSKCPAI